MRKRSRGSRGWWRWAVPVMALLTWPSCVFIVSTAPTSLAGANIVFVAVDDHGVLVASLGVTVVAVQGDWQQSGTTAGDGSFTCSIASGVSRVRADVRPPAGYVLAEAKAWPREVAVPSGGSLRVEIRVRQRP